MSGVFVAVCLKLDINVCKAALQIFMWQTHEATCKNTACDWSLQVTTADTIHSVSSLSHLLVSLCCKTAKYKLCSQSYIFQGWIEVIYVNWKLHLVELYIITESHSVSAAPSGVLSWHVSPVILLQQSLYTVQWSCEPAKRTSCIKKKKNSKTNK